MSTVEVVPLTDFTHDEHTFREGRKKPDVDKTLALDLEAKSLVRIVAPVPDVMRGRRYVGVDPGKVQAAGKVQPSSASPVAQASRPTTAPSSASGATPTRKAGRS